MFDELAHIITHDLPDVLANNERVGGTVNLIDKMVVDNPDGSFGFKSYHSASRGVVPMMTKNCSYDFAFAGGRILAKPALYEGENKAGQIRRAFEDAIDAYHTQTGYALDFEEMKQGMKMQAAAQMAYGIGYNMKSPGGHKPTAHDMADHIVTQTLPQFKNICALP